MIPNNTCPPRITAAAGTKLAGASFAGTFKSEDLIPCRQWFTHLNASSHTWRCCVRVAPIAQNSLLLPPIGVWAVSQSQCGRSPSQAGYPSLPWWAFTRQQANGTQTHPRAIRKPFVGPTCDGLTLFGISPPLGGLSPTRGKIIYVLLTRSPLNTEMSRSTCMY